MRATIVILAACVLFGAPDLVRAETIEGLWTVSNGEKVTYRRCGADFCSTIDTGAFAGKSVGRMSGSGPEYTGTIVDPESDKTYEGRALVEGRRLTLTGCVAKIFCRSQVFTR